MSGPTVSVLVPSIYANCAEILGHTHTADNAMA
jgi:hypothetical protein